MFTDSDEPCIKNLMIQLNELIDELDNKNSIIEQLTYDNIILQQELKKQDIYLMKVKRFIILCGQDIDKSYISERYKHILKN